MSSSWWDWRFRGSPASECAMAGAFTPEGRCLAMFGGVKVPFWLDGEECHAITIRDCAVDTEFRRGLSGPRLMRRVAVAFLELFGGGTTQMMYGFPQPGLRRIALRFRIGEHLADTLFLIHDLHREPRAHASIEVRVVHSCSTEVDELWRTCRGELQAAIVRDASYLDHRFRDHPGVDYDLLEARDAGDGRLRGIAVLREGGWDPAIASLVEWLVPLGDEEAEATLLHHAVRWARSHGRQNLACWFPAMHLRARRFQVTHGFYMFPSPYVQIFRSYRNGIDRQWMYDHAYHTMGDIDFF